MKEKRKTYFSSKKVGIIREQLKGGYILSQISEKYQIHLTQLLRWKKELFEDLTESRFQNNVKDIS